MIELILDILTERILDPASLALVLVGLVVVLLISPERGAAMEPAR